MSEHAGKGSAPARRKIRYIAEFDGIRGVAALFVVSAHGFMVVIPAQTQLPNEIPGTFVFIDMFFVMSGFLITALLLREQESTGRIGLWAFYVRRGLRLLPALYFLLLVHGIYAYWRGAPDYPADVERRTLIAAALYGLNFQLDTLLSPVAKGLTQLWSLSVEEQFYLVWPLVVIFFLPSRRKLSTVVIVLTTLIAAVVVHRALLWDDSMSQTTAYLRLYTHTDTRADSLLVGALAAYLWVHGVLPSKRVITTGAWIALPLLIWFLFFVELDDPFAYKGGFTLMALAWATVVIACVETDWHPRRVLRIGVLCALGQVSYGIYLWHVPIQFAVRELGGTWPVAVRVIVSLVATAFFVALSWYLVEQPFLRWKDRLDRRQAKGASGDTSPPTSPATSPPSSPPAVPPAVPPAGVAGDVS